MKKGLFYFCLIYTMIGCQQKPTPVEQNPEISAEEKQIARQLIQGAFDDLWSGVDSTKLLDYHTDDFIILEQGEIWDNDRIKVFMREQLARPQRPKRINKMDYIAIEKYGESMQIAYHNFADFVEADSLVFQARWLESALAVKTEVGWRLKMMHSTWVPIKKE
ncbi:MAG: hypothetical protein AAF985_02060 [Bacteroidota bacterium]